MSYQDVSSEDRGLVIRFVMSYHAIVLVYITSPDHNVLLADEPFFVDQVEISRQYQIDTKLPVTKTFD